VMRLDQKETLMHNLSATQVSKVNMALDNHDKLKKSYFWKSNGNTSSRRYQESLYSMDIRFKHNHHQYRYTSDVSISCRNFRYWGAFYIDDQQKDVRLFKKLLPKETT
jgi:hypothetical protein